MRRRSPCIDGRGTLQHKWFETGSLVIVGGATGKLKHGRGRVAGQRAGSDNAAIDRIDHCAHGATVRKFGGVLPTAPPSNSPGSSRCRLTPSNASATNLSVATPVLACRRETQ